jgi:ribosome-associated heat shock protein Hsp15
VNSVRLDTWLDVACLFKTRSEAQRACKIGRVSVNHVTAKPHRELRVGDQVAITRPGDARQVVFVRGLAAQHVPKAEARQLYEDRTPPPSPEQQEIRRLERLHRAATGTSRLDRRNQRHAARRKWTT